MYQPQNFLPQASKTFASAPGQLPRDVVTSPHRKGPLRGETPKKWTAEGAFAPPGEQPVGPAT
ncbi:hypothetical protein [Escherichia coli]|uniref:hypothetical protein n=1 Tax=Escherichia coli TaxID=562 RepID=UPI001560C15A|nr:hypothetical protein [Escherichia coli]